MKRSWSSQGVGESQGDFKRRRIFGSKSVVANDRGRYMMVRGLYAGPARRPGTARVIDGRVYTGPIRSGGYTGRFSGPGAELKFHDVSLNMTAASTITASTTGTTGLLNLIAAGDGQSNRDGRQCTIKNIYVNGRVVWNPSTSIDGETIFYMWVVLDTQANGAAPSPQDVFQSTSNFPFEVLHNLENSKRFRILHKVQRKLKANVGTPASSLPGVYSQVTFNKKVNIPLDFSGTTGAVTEVKSNNIFCIWAANPLSAPGTCLFDGFARLRFYG